MIEIENLGKLYYDNWGVRNLSLTVADGEIMAFIGPNGAGKTTTIKLLAGLLKPTEGRSLIDGFDVQLQPTEAKRLLGYIPDRPYLYEKLSGRDFMKFIADLFEVDPVDRDRQMDRYFELFDLTPSADMLIENYSHGMRQKLIFSASLMHNPRVLIIDEPLVGLDPRSVRLVKDLFREEAKNGKSVFLSTHTLSVAEEIADRIGIVDRGKLIFLGDMEQLREAGDTSGNLEELFLHLTEAGEDLTTVEDVAG